jgi:hypothetical protein
LSHPNYLFAKHIQALYVKTHFALAARCPSLDIIVALFLQTFPHTKVFSPPVGEFRLHSPLAHLAVFIDSLIIIATLHFLRVILPL